MPASGLIRVPWENLTKASVFNMVGVSLVLNVTMVRHVLEHAFFWEIISVVKYWIR